MFSSLFAQTADTVEAAKEAAATLASEAVGNKILLGDYVVFFLFLAAVIFVAFGMSRKSAGSSEDYFLAGRGLKWWLIGFSLIAANISAEQFVGMSGQGADYIGLAVASYEWIAALSLVLVAFFFLPKFLKAGIYTIPEYLEKRYNKWARLIMSIMMMIMLIVVNITVVTYAGAKAYAVFFEGININLSFIKEGLVLPLNLQFFCWVIGIIAALYIFAGGLKACAWADLLQGSALIAAGGLVLVFALQKLGAADPSALALNVAPEGTEEFNEALTNLTGASSDWDRFNVLNAAKLRMNLPSWDLIIPVTALILAIWIPNLYYWGLNQYIIQRTLGSKTLGEGQKGLVFAAFMKLLIPFIVIFPGMIAFNLYSADMNAKATVASQKELERFEKVKNAPTTEEELFQFSRSFAQRDPETALEMLEYNSKVLAGAVVKKDFPDEAESRDVEALAEDVLEFDEEALGEYPTLQTSPVSPKKGYHRPKFVGKEERMADADLLQQQLIALKDVADDIPNLKFGKMVSGYDTDSALSILMDKVVPSNGFKGFMLAALLGAIISSVAAMLNAASTIFTMDLFNECGVKPKDDLANARRQKVLVAVGRGAVVVFALIGCLVAPIWANPKYGGVFTAIQEFQGYISPGIFAAFVIGFWMRKAPNYYGVIALLGCPILYGSLAICCPTLDFLNRMAVTFLVLIAIAVILRIAAPRKVAYVQTVPELPTDAALQAELAVAVEGVSDEERAKLTALYRHKMTQEKWAAFLKPSYGALIFGLIVVVLTVWLYLKYWDWTSPMM
ncbi:MAG: sodium/solute symporter [Thermoguttaceae bacterium]|nr:sodium/solute symporter [Thermoguttaceae bacterium]